MKAVQQFLFAVLPRARKSTFLRGKCCGNLHVFYGTVLWFAKTTAKPTLIKYPLRHWPNNIFMPRGIRNDYVGNHRRRYHSWSSNEKLTQDPLAKRVPFLRCEFFIVCKISKDIKQQKEMILPPLEGISNFLFFENSGLRCISVDIIALNELWLAGKRKSLAFRLQCLVMHWNKVLVKFLSFVLSGVWNEICSYHAQIWYNRKLTAITKMKKLAFRVLASRWSVSLEKLIRRSWGALKVWCWKSSWHKRFLNISSLVKIASL